jgi:hypothetical protein
MIQRLLLLSVVFFWLSSSFSSGQETTSTDYNITDNVLDPADIEGIYDNCIPGLDCWNGNEDGGDPNWSGSAAYWGFGGGILKWTSAINTALETAGIQIDGYNYKWYVKNYDTNYVAEQNDGDDYMRISVRIYDKSGKEVWGKQYNLDGTYNWKSFTGTELFDDSLVADNLGDVIIRAEGKDNANWAGYYGPEFDVSQSYVKFIYSPIPDPCNDVPVVDPNCENFIGAPPQEDPAVKQLVIIESTGSIPLSEDELAVLEALEEAEPAQEAIQEQPEVIVEELEETTSNVDALSVARNAEASALAEAASTIDNTLSATATSLQSDIQQSQQTNEQAQQQAEQANQEAMASAGFDLLSNDGNISVTSILSQIQNSDKSDVVIEITVDSYEIAALDNAINDALFNLRNLEQNILKEQIENSEQEEELNEPVSNEQEDELVAAALAGSDDEDAQAALLGFNPNFRAYQQPQMTDADFYKPKDIYAGQKNYDNPNARFFNGASDATHREMVRQQYEGN